MSMSPFVNFVMSALLVTTCAEAVAPPAKNNMSRARIKAAGIPNNMKRARKQPACGRAAIFRECFRLFIMLVSKFKFHFQRVNRLAHVNQCVVAWFFINWNLFYAGTGQFARLRAEELEKLLGAGDGVGHDILP